MRVHRQTTRLLRLVAALSVTLLVSTGCLIGPSGNVEQSTAQSGTAGGPQRTPAGSPPGASADALDGSKSVAEFQKDVDDAAGLAAEYWRKHLTDSGVRFRQVRQVVAYEREGEITCGGQPLGLRNAAYCSAGDFIAYDVNWSVAAFRQIGDAFVFYLLGHEYAHGVQLRLGIRSRFTIQQELQADCMAGAYLGDSVRSGRLKLSPGDLDEFRSGLLAVGDDPSQPWFAEGAHGTAEQRTASFFDGYEGSLPRCGLS